MFVIFHHTFHFEADYNFFSSEDKDTWRQISKSPYDSATLSQTPIQTWQWHRKLNTIKGSRPTHNYEPTLGQLTTSGRPSSWLPLGKLVKHNRHPRDAVTNNAQTDNYKTNIAMGIINQLNWTNPTHNAPTANRQTSTSAQTLSGIANLNLLEKYRARHQQLLIHDRQWQQRRDDDTDNTNNTKYKDWDRQHQHFQI